MACLENWYSQSVAINLTDLDLIFKGEWRKMPVCRRANLVEAWSKRLAALSAAKGGFSK